MPKIVFARLKDSQVYRGTRAVSVKPRLAIRLAASMCESSLGRRSARREGGPSRILSPLTFLWDSPNLSRFRRSLSVARTWEMRSARWSSATLLPVVRVAETAVTRAHAWDGTDGAQGFSECKTSDHRCGVVCVARVFGHPGTSLCTTSGSARKRHRVEPPCDARSLLRHLPQPTTRDSGIEVGRRRCRQPRRKR